MVSELDALRAAKLLLDQHGAQETRHILNARALDEHLSGKVQARNITLQVLGALCKLTVEPDDKPRH